MKRKILVPALILAAGVATAGGLAYAQQSGVTQNDAMAALANAKVSLVQAVTTAEQHAGGRASRAELETVKGRLVYEVEVTDAKQTLDVKVDAIDGSVISAQVDRSDREASEDRRDERDERGDRNDD